LTLANAIKGGYLKNLSPQADGAIPFIKAFFLGGSSTIRGFDAAKRAFHLLPISLNNHHHWARQVIPGYNRSYFVLTKSELRLPIYKDFGVAAFL